MWRKSKHLREYLPWLGAVWLLSCGESNTEPTEVPYGETTFVVLVNPIINALNQATVPGPGTTQAGITVSVTNGPSNPTDAAGVVVLNPIAPGTSTLTLSGAGSTGQLPAAITDRDLRELAVALTPAGAALMANVQYAFGGEVVEVTPVMSVNAVNAQLARSNVIVFFRAGTYAGDLRFAGSDVTLYGEGPRGRSVTLNGNVEISGSRNRVRGARITGTLTVPGSDFGMSFSQVVGSTQIAGSNTTLLQNTFCGAVTIPGSGARVLGNAGMAPLPVPAGGC